jgi:ABC-type transport system involved in multi-copper enzyme maturation permease subunit
MTLPAAFFVVRCLVRDTFRQSLASRTFWLVLGLSAVCIVVCLSVRLEGYTAVTPKGEIELFGPDRQPFTGLNKQAGTFSVAFGAIRLRQFRDGQAEVAFLQTVLAKWGAGAVGLLLVLLWTSGFLPEFLDPRAATVLLAKPVPRWSLLAGKYLGVLAFVTFQASVFVGGTWLALGLATDVWHPAYLLTVPLLVLEFALLYSVSALLAVWTRSTVVCIFGTLLFWALCSSVDVGRHAVVAAGGASEKAPPAVEAAYWVLPKPADVVLLLDGVLQSDRHFQGPPAQQAMQKAVDPELSLLSSLLFTGAVLGLAGRRFATREY